ncbi:hypothetical protein GCM10029978_013670 [Actinoallomurus acanthiterrae]
MAFPGDKQQPGGWGPPQPPQSQYGPAEDQATGSGSLFDRPYGTGARQNEEPANQYGGPPSYDQASPYGAQQPSGPDQETRSYGQEAGGWDNNSAAGPYGGGAGGYGPPGGPSRYGDVPGGYGEDAASFAPGGEERSGSGKKPLIIGAAVVAGVVVLGGGTALALSGGGGDDKPNPSATTSKAAAAPKQSPTANPTPSTTETGKGERLASRATDPKPLTLSEVFKNKTFKLGGRNYVLTTRRADTNCAKGVNGTTFTKAIKRAGCTQVLRATFSNGKFIGTIGVLNLKTDSVASAAQKASRPKDAYIVPLPGAGSTSKIGKGLSLTTADPEGHYLIMSWVQYPDGKKIATSDYSGVTAFVQNATVGSNLRPALNYRSMVGKPA